MATKRPQSEVIVHAQPNFYKKLNKAPRLEIDWLHHKIYELHQTIEHLQRQIKQLTTSRQQTINGGSRNSLLSFVNNKKKFFSYLISRRFFVFQSWYRPFSVHDMMNVPKTFFITVICSAYFGLKISLAFNHQKVSNALTGYSLKFWLRLSVCICDAGSLAIQGDGRKSAKWMLAVSRTQQKYLAFLHVTEEAKTADGMKRIRCKKRIQSLSVRKWKHHEKPLILL